VLRITQHIGKLLLDHDCVIVPGLGGFVGNYQPAKMHPTSYIFNSPAKSVAFNVNLKHNDGLLINAIVREEVINTNQAEQHLREFVDQIQDALHEHKPVKLPGIGRLTVDVENNIVFIPDNSENYLLNSYGLYSFNAPPVLREKETAIRHVEKVIVRQEKRKKSFSDVFLPIAAVLLLLLITVQIYVQSTMQGFNYAEIFGINKLQQEEVILDRYKPVEIRTNNTIFNYRAADTAAAVIAPLENTALVTPDTNKEETSTLLKKSEKVKYLLIAGALNEIGAAQKIVDDLKKKNYEGYVIERNGYQMVAIGIPDTVSPATYRELFIDDTGIGDAWVLRNK